MGLIFILPIAILAGWSIVAIYRWLRRGGYDGQWWRSYYILGSIGVLVGIFLAFFLEFSVVNTHMRGFPIPSEIAYREKPGAPWTLAEMPAAISAAAKLTNFFSGIALCLAPIAIAAFLKENRGKLIEFPHKPQTPPTP